MTHGGWKAPSTISGQAISRVVSSPSSVVARKIARKAWVSTWSVLKLGLPVQSAMSLSAPLWASEGSLLVGVEQQHQVGGVSELSIS